MLLWLFNLLDLIVAINLIAAHFGAFQIIALFSMIYLIGKGIIFIKDPFSILDIIIGLYFIILLLGIKTFLTWIFFAYLIYKIVVSITY